MYPPASRSPSHPLPHAPHPPHTHTRAGSNSADGAYALFLCGTVTSTSLTVARLDGAGLVDTSTTFAVAAGHVGGVASQNGSFVYATAGTSLFLGPFGSALTAASGSGTHTYYGAALYPPAAASPTLVSVGCAAVRVRVRGVVG